VASLDRLNDLCFVRKETTFREERIVNGERQQVLYLGSVDVCVSSQIVSEQRGVRMCSAARYVNFRSLETGLKLKLT